MDNDFLINLKFLPRLYIAYNILITRSDGDTMTEGSILPPNIDHVFHELAN